MNDDKASAEAGPMNIATISAGFEKGDFLVREEQGNRVYFDFFEEVGSLSVSETRPVLYCSKDVVLSIPGRAFYGGELFSPMGGKLFGQCI